MIFSEHYKNKEAFDPDRFSFDRREDKQGGRYNYPVFGGGQRACPGQFLAFLILKLLIVEMVRSTTWELLEPDKVKIRTIPVEHPVDGLPVKFRRRKEECLSTDENHNEEWLAAAVRECPRQNVDVYRPADSVCRTSGCGWEPRCSIKTLKFYGVYPFSPGIWRTYDYDGFTECRDQSNRSIIKGKAFCWPITTMLQ